MKVLLLVLFAIYLNANDLHENIKNFIGEDKYKRHTFLIKKLFIQKDSFYINDKLKYSKIFKILDKNGLLDLKFKKPKTIEIEFESISSSIQTIKMIKDVLSTLGYSYYFTNFLEKRDDKLIWQINLKSESMLNPSILISKLEDLNVVFMNVKKINDIKWKYEIDLNYANIANTIIVQNNEKIILKKPHKPYFLKVSNASELKVVSRVLNKWYPYISFYDKNLELLSIVHEKKVFKTLITNIAEGTQYITIGDTYTLLNIKRGLSVTLR